jgi:hypothetical protein
MNCCDVITLCVSIIFVIVGLCHVGSPCAGSATVFLLLTGLLHLASLLSNCCCGETAMKYVYWAVDVILILWGTFSVFGANSTWQTSSPGPTFCDAAPFQLAMMYLVIFWILVFPACFALCFCSDDSD